MTLLALLTRVRNTRGIPWLVAAVALLATVRPALAEQAKQPPPQKPAPDLLSFPSLGDVPQQPAPKQQKAEPPPLPPLVGHQDDLELLAFPALPPMPELSLEELKARKLCAFPFSQRSSDKGAVDIAKIFVDVAKSSVELRDTEALKIWPECRDPSVDPKCYIGLGLRANCETVLVGTAKPASDGKGLILSTSWISVSKEKIVSHNDSWVASDDSNEITAWAEGQACSALRLSCKSALVLDVDRSDISLFLNKRIVPRNPSRPNEIALSLPPGLHSLQAAIGQRPSPDKQIPLRRNSKLVVYTRQNASGGFNFQLGGMKPPPSADFRPEAPWTKRAGMIVGAAAIVVGGLGTYELLHGRSQTSQVDNAATSRGGGYTQAELGTLSSGQSNQRVGGAFLIASAVMLAASATLTFAF